MSPGPCPAPTPKRLPRTWQAPRPVTGFPLRGNLLEHGAEALPGAGQERPMPQTFRLTLAQMNPVVGDLAGNAARARAAWEAGKGGDQFF